MGDDMALRQVGREGHDMTLVMMPRLANINAMGYNRASVTIL